MNDLNLISKLVRREQSAMTELYEKYGGALYGHILRMVGSTVVAEDVLQESLLKIWNKIETYDPAKGRLFTWMIQIVRNATLDEIRSKGYRKASMLRAISELDMEQFGRRGDMTTEMVTDTIGLDVLLQKLDHDLTEVLDVVYLRGFTHREAAAALGLPLGTVKSRVRIAVRELRKLTEEIEH